MWSLMPQSKSMSCSRDKSIIDEKDDIKELLNDHVES
jgi:hypothetical protein